MGVFGSKFFSNFTQIFTPKENGFDGMFNANQVCCDTPKTGVLGSRRNVLPADHGHSGVFNQNPSLCCDPEDKESEFFGLTKLGRD